MFDSFSRGRRPAGHSWHSFSLRQAAGRRWIHLATCLLAVFAFTPVPVWAGALPEPFWSIDTAISTDDGYADLHWAVAGSEPVDFFRLTERFNGTQAIHFVDHPTTRLYRIEPGLYEFWVQSCRRDAAGYPDCGAMSARLALTVTDEVLALQSESRVSFRTSPVVVRSPSGFAPGRWHNPDSPGHGWSFYWKSRLSHHPSHPEYGDAWDLLGIWYTYEARVRTPTVPGTCPGPDCSWVYDDYKPVYARMWLTRVDSQQYHGSVYITRSNIVTNVGSVSVSFSQDNTSAELAWGANFKWQYLQGSDGIELLVGPDSDPVDNPAHYSGLWELPPDGEYLVAHALGWTSESVEVMFEDEDGQPAWIMAVGDDPVAGHTDLCFFYVTQGFPPGTSGNVQFYEMGCDADLSAGLGNRNGSRRFTNFEREDFWVNFDLPGGSAPDHFIAGTASSPDRLHKHASFHRIEYASDSGANCQLQSGSPVCQVSLTWFSDGDFPDTSAFVHNTGTGERLFLASDTVMQDFEACIDAPGEWTFELRMGNSPDSTLMGVSDPFTVTGTATSVCGGGGGSGGGSGSPETPPPPAPAPAMTPTLASSRTGATAGEFSVTPVGAANYRIPILAAPGSGGLAPSVALVYDSQAGNGPVGVGWGIDGFSVISRCAQTIEQDAASRPGRISFSQQDRFCLDGERLMAVNGAYGAAATEYRKERDDFTRVISYGAGGSGPSYFVAWSRDGKVFHFGRTADSRIETRAEGMENVAFAWAQNRVEDTAGNYMEFRYSERPLGDVDFVLEKILYTGNSTAGTSPYAEIRFVYSGARADSQAVYTAGVAASHGRLLERVDSLSRIAAGTTLKFLRSYLLDYGVDGWGRAVLESVSECHDASASICFQPSRFQWQKSEHVVSASGPDASALFTGDFRGLALADSNGDGRADLLITEREGTGFEFGVAWGSASGGFTQGAERYDLPPGDKPEAPVALTAIDLNADGYQDVLYTRKISGAVRWYGRLAGPSGMGNEIVMLENCCGLLSPPLLQVMDFNGDGLSDIITNRPVGISEEASEIVVLINDFEPGDPQPAFQPPLVVKVHYPDLFPSRTSTGWELADPAPTFGFQSSGYKPGRVDDFHGDGSVDILVRLSRKYRRCPYQVCWLDGAAGSFDSSQSLFVFEEDEAPSRAAPGINPPGEELAYATFYLVFFADENGEYSTYDIIAKGAGEDCGVTDVCNPHSTLPQVRRTQPVDVNADGLADVAYLDQDFDWHYRTNTGAGFLPPRLIAQPPDDERAELARFIDITGDGYAEFLYPNLLASDSAVWMVQYNDLGNGFSVAQASTMPVGNTLQGDASIMLDFTGDGIIDQLVIDWRTDGNGAQSGTTRLRRGINGISGKTGEAGSMILAFEDGFGDRTEVDYRSLTDPEVHSRMNDSAQAMWGRNSVVYDLPVPFYVVSSVKTSAPIFGNPGAKAHRQFHYVGAKIQAGGRGFLGFTEVIEYDVQNGLRSNTRYRQDFPYSGLVGESRLYLSNFSDRFDSITNILQKHPTSWLGLTATAPLSPTTAGGVLIRSTIHEWRAVRMEHGTGVWSLRPAAELSREFATEGPFKRKTFITRTFDYFANITAAEERQYLSDGTTEWSRVSTENEWINDQSRWRLGRLSSTHVTHYRSGAGPEIVRRSAFAYHPFSSLLVRETAEPGHATRQVVTSYALDAFGNRVGTTIQGIGMASRGQSASFDGLGRFAVETRNIYNQVTQRVLEWDVFGNPLRTQNVDGVTQWQAADHMGRPFASYVETGNWARSDLVRGGHAQCPSGTAFHAIATASGQPKSIECFDPRGRTHRKAVEGFLGGWIYVDSYFDVAGWPERVSEPYFAGSPSHWNSSLYDALGRLRESTAANGLKEQVLYDLQGTHCGRSAVRAVLMRTLPGDGTMRQQWELQNVAGEVVEVVDDACSKIAYDYDAAGNLVELVNIGGSVITIDYDDLGLHKVQMNDPDKGLWQYASNALGEVTRQLDGKQQAIDFEYDQMGRVVHRRERTGVSTLEDTAFQTRNHEIRIWQNTTAPGVTGRGQISQERYVAGEAGPVLHERTYRYDAFGRAESVEHMLEGRAFTETTTYDEFGRVFQRFDASGNSQGVRYHYNSRGYLQKIQEARQGEDGVVYQEILAVDQRGNPTAMVLGNQSEVFAEYEPATGHVKTLETYSASGAELQRVDYSFDRLGNLQWRHDRSGSSDMREDFDYDDLSRLERVMLTAPALGLSQRLTQSMVYDASGNITYKSGVGSYTYGAGNAGPHAVTRAGALSYSYDGNGNQVSSSDGRTIAYGVFDKPTRIAKGTDYTEFTYGLANERYKRVDNNDVDGQKTVWTIGSAEFIEEVGSAARFKRYIGGIAILDYFPLADASEVWYIARDHLGSVHTISDAGSHKALENHFDAWGMRQRADWQTPLSVGAAVTANGFTTRGFTGHEHADDLGIIHMNGRIYDPRLGRFLQADPFVQAPRNGQSLNRYSYALNNPLSYTDPSGYFLKRLIQRWGRVIIAAVASYFTFGVAYAGAASAIASGVSHSLVFAQFIGTVGWQVAAGVAAGAASGLVAGAILTGSLRGAVKSAFVGAITGGIVGHFGDNYTASRVFADSVAGGVTAEIYGESFRDGLLSAALSSSATLVNVRLRAYQLAQSSQFPAQIGKSAGFRGLPGKLAGERIFEDLWIDSGAATLYAEGEPIQKVLEVYRKAKRDVGPISPLGCLQGGAGCVIGLQYKPGGLLDYIFEGYAGVHDSLNQPFFYTSRGTHIRISSPILSAAGRVINFSNVLLATPIVVPSLVPDYMRHYYFAAQER